MIGSNIKRLRTERGMTQKALADKLFVSAQAVSRWENNEVEPSLTTITEMAKIFGVSTDEILGVAPQPQPPKPEETPKDEKSENDSPRATENTTTNNKEEKEKSEPQPTILALCTECNTPIYFQEDIVRLEDKSIICKKCHNEKIARERKAKEAKYRAAVEAGKKRRIISFIVLAAIILIGTFAAFYACSSAKDRALSITGSIFISFLVSCIILKNNFVGDMCLNIFEWSFVTWPGIIFSFDIGGFIFLIAIKILFFVLGILLSILCAAIALIVGSIVAIFVYPYALYKNFTDPAYMRDDF